MYSHSMHAPKVLATGCSGLSTLGGGEEEEYCCLKVEVGEGHPENPQVSQTAADMTRPATHICSLSSRTFHLGTGAAPHGGVKAPSGWLSPVQGQHLYSLLLLLSLLETPVSLSYCAFLRGCPA